MYPVRLPQLCLALSALLSGCALIGYDLGGGDSNAGSLADGGVNVQPPDEDGGGSGGGGGSNSTGRGDGGTSGSGAGSGGSLPGDAGNADGGDGPTADAGDAGSPEDVCPGMPDGTPCDDGQFCSEAETCMGGVCGPAPEPDCSAFDGPCTHGACLEDLDRCVAKPVADGTPCGFGLACFDGACENGERCPPDTDCTFGCADDCNYECTDANTCTVGCELGTSCETDCTRANNCSLTCSAATCNLDCSDANNCDAVCSQGDCVIDCTGATNCDNVICAQGATCAIQCGDGGSDTDCAFGLCMGGETQCGSNVIVCNGSCTPSGGGDWWSGRGW